MKSIIMIPRSYYHHIKQPMWLLLLLSGGVDYSDTKSTVSTKLYKEGVRVIRQQLLTKNFPELLIKCHI